MFLKKLCVFLKLFGKLLNKNTTLIIDRFDGFSRFTSYFENYKIFWDFSDPFKHSIFWSLGPLNDCRGAILSDTPTTLARGYPEFTSEYPWFEGRPFTPRLF